MPCTSRCKASLEARAWDESCSNAIARANAHYNLIVKGKSKLRRNKMGIEGGYRFRNPERVPETGVFDSSRSLYTAEVLQLELQNALEEVGVLVPKEELMLVSAVLTQATGNNPERFMAVLALFQP